MVDEVRSAYADDEIDLVELMQTIWDGKWLVAAFAAIAVVLGGAFAFLKPAVFEATTEIKVVSTVDASAYDRLNELEFFGSVDREGDEPRFIGIDQDFLLKAYIEELDRRTLFEDAIRNYGLLNREEYESDTDYDTAVTQLAAEISIQPPVNVDGTAKGEIRRHWTIQFEGTDKAKWLAALEEVTTNSTNKVRETLIERFNTAVEVAQQGRAFKLEDLSTSIDNAVADYDRRIGDRLAFLYEQSAIARKLGVARNTLEAQTFSSASGVVANVQSNTPFYLRGYEAIEKEIELIEKRKNKLAFVDGLIELENEKRALEQDKTIDRAEELFAKTPVNDAEQFVAAQYDVFATNIESKSKRSLIVALALVLGGMVGVMFVLIRSAVRKRKATA